MERSEPALIPEWLRSTGNVTGGGTSSPHFVSSSLHSDVSSSFSMRNRCSRSNSDKDIYRPSFLERSSSSNSGRSSVSNGSAKHPYSSFTRSQRDRNREKDKERSVAGDLWDRDSSDPLENILISGIDKRSFGRSHSLVPRRTSEGLPRRTEDSKNGAQSNQYNGNGMILGSSNLSGIQKASFDKDFPSLGADEKQVGSGRVSSPVLSTAVQNLPIGSSGLLGGEKWTSALAQVPAIIGSNTMMDSASQPSAVVAPSSGASSTMTSLNMAEALSQATPRARAAPQVPDKCQSREELAIKQSKLMPKTSASNSFEKSKQPKAAVRPNELITSSRSMQQQQHYSTQFANQARGGQVRADASSTSHAGKFLVLKPARENGVTSIPKDAFTPVNTAIKVANGQLPVAPLTSTALTSPSNPKVPTRENKAAALTLNPRPNVGKKPSSSQAQSRSDFFNLMRKKTLLSTSSDVSDLSPAIISPAEKVDENSKEVKSASVSPRVTEKCSQMITNGDSHGPLDEAQNFSDGETEKNMCLNGTVYPDEEEAAFLRSLGWEENGEDEGLTEEEINAFYQEYMNLKPSLKTGRGIPPKLWMLSESRSSNSLAASESGTGGSESEA